MTTMSSTFSSAFAITPPASPETTYRYRRHASSPAFQTLLQTEILTASSTPSSPSESRKRYAKPLRPKSFLRPPVAQPKPIPKEITSASSEFFYTVKVKALIGDSPPVPIISEDQTVAEAIEALGKRGVSFIVVRSADMPVASFTIVDIVKFCLQECNKIPHFDLEEDDVGSVDSFSPIEPQESEWIATACQQLEDVLSTVPMKEIISHANVHPTSLSPSSSLASLMKALCLEKRVAITENGKFVAMITRDYLIEFLWKNRNQLGPALRAPIFSPHFELRRIGPEATKAKKVVQMFHILWEKQMNGALACSKRCSALDLFLNWFHYAQKVVEDGDPEDDEPETIEEDENLNTVVEFFARRKGVRTLYVREVRGKHLLGRITRKDLLFFVLFQ